MHAWNPALCVLSAEARLQDVQHQPGGQGARKRDRRGLCGVGKVLERNEKLLEGLKQRTILRFTFYLS